MSSSEHQPVIVNIENGNSRIYQIIATLLFCGAVGMIAFSLAQNGWLDIAATGLTMFLNQLIRMLISNGLMELPKLGGGNGDERAFAETSSHLRTMMNEFQQWRGRSPIWRLALLAFAYTLVFMTARAAMKVGLTIFSNVWVAGAAASVVAALIIFPGLFVAPAARLKSKQRKAAKVSARSTHTEDGE